MQPQPLILAGFMGTGKSTVGRLCARALNYEFVDADAEIEQREGMSIPYIFERHGETYFRARESELAQELAQRERIVVATGGGMIVNDANRAALLASGLCVCLTASPEAILQRIGEEAASARPMLRGGEAQTRIASLLKERAPAYRQLHYHIDTMQRTPEEVAETVVGIYRAEQGRILVNIPDARANYDIVMGDDLLDQIGFMLAGRGWTSPFAIVSDSIISSYFGGRVMLALKRAGIESFIYTLPPGERHKNLGSIEALYRIFSERGMERSSPVIALGGGVIGDVAGFAAATYLRGVPLVQMPTSLLAMADSSIGGKTGVDTSFGKNLIGAFRQPDLVVADMSCLLSLPIEELRCGMAEIVKAALISGGEPYARLREALQAKPISQAEPYETGEDGWVTGEMVNALVDAILFKRAIVQQDPFEKGERALLNLGHTFGHAIEQWSDYRAKHGQCVSLGMVCAARLSQMMGLCNDDLVRNVIEMLDDVGLPTSMERLYEVSDGIPSLDVEAVWRIMQSDKKKRAGKLRFVLIHAPGDVFVCDEVDEATAKQALIS